MDENDNEAVVEMKQSLKGLMKSLEGAKLDSLIVLMVTSAVIPIFNRLNASPIIGFLLTGALLGPAGNHVLYTSNIIYVYMYHMCT